MPRKKVNLAFIESNTERKTSYKKRQKGLLKKTQELGTLCDVEVTTVIYSPYHSEPKVFPNQDAAINTFTKFKELPELEQSKNTLTQEKFTKQRIEKIEEQLQKVRKKNRCRELTNKMYEMLNGKNISVDMHPYDLNDMCYVINQNLKQVCEAIKEKVDKEDSTSNALQSIVGPILPSGIISKGPMAFMAHPTPSTTMTSPIPLHMMNSTMSALVSPLTTPQINPSMKIPIMGTSVLMNNYQNYFDVSQNSELSEMLDWNNDNAVTLLDDPYFNNIDVREPNHNNNNF